MGSGAGRLGENLFLPRCINVLELLQWLPQTWWLKTIHIYSLSSSGAQKSKIHYPWAKSLWDLLLSYVTGLPPAPAMLSSGTFFIDLHAFGHTGRLSVHTQPAKLFHNLGLCACYSLCLECATSPTPCFFGYLTLHASIPTFQVPS